jgi:hypothetical protein
MKITPLFASSFVTILLASHTSAVELASVFTDHMVLQQEMEVPVWGKANPDESVTVTFADQKATAKAGADGKWLVGNGVSVQILTKSPSHLRSQHAAQSANRISRCLLPRHGAWQPARNDFP